MFCSTKLLPLPIIFKATRVIMITYAPLHTGTRHNLLEEGSGTLDMAGLCYTRHYFRGVLIKCNRFN